MVNFKITFKLEEPFAPLEKKSRRAVTKGKKHGYSDESIIETVLSEYDVTISCGVEKLFNSTVHLNEFLYELFRFAFYAITEEVPKDVKSYGWSFNSLEELPDWLYKEVKVSEQLLGQEFTELTSKLFLRSFLGSYDPTIVVYGFKKGEYFYFMSIDYQKVCKLPIGKFLDVTTKVVDDAIRELESCVHIFDRNGIQEYRELINDYKSLLKNLKSRIEVAH